MTNARSTQVKAMIRDAMATFSADLGRARVFLYGSRATHSARQRSDFDVAIDGPEPIDPRLLHKIRLAMDELPTLYRVDLVDLTQVPAKVRNEMLRHVEVIL